MKERKSLLKKKVYMVVGIILAAFFACLLGVHVYKGRTEKEEVIEETLSEETTAVESKVQKQVFLTFDDGPSEQTGQVLAILEKYQIPATFFLIANQIDEKTEKVVKQAVKQGCMIGVHTYCHEADTIYQSAQSYYSDVMEAKDVIEETIQQPVKLYRFPWGSCNCYVSSYKKEIIDLFTQQGMEYADWNVSGEDSVGRPTADTILQHVKNDLTIAKDPVILLHDSSINEETVKALPAIIELFLEKGYTFDTLDNRKEPCHFTF